MSESATLYDFITALKHLEIARYLLYNLPVRLNQSLIILTGPANYSKYNTFAEKGSGKLHKRVL